MNEGSDDWRPIVAALADDRVRATYARTVLGEGLDDALTRLTASARPKVRDVLTRTGLVVVGVDGVTSADGGPFRRLLAAQPKGGGRKGVERFLRDGRIDRYPANAGERRELLELVARRAFPSGETFTETQVNDRLAPFADDVAGLRRGMVDHGILERTRSGSSYALVP